MKTNACLLMASTLLVGACLSADAQIGKRFPSERKVVKDPVTGTMLTFVTSKGGDSKIYQTHNQWTSDGEWLIFRSNRAGGEAMAVNEKTGDLVQVTDGGYSGMLNIARKSMKLYFMRTPRVAAPQAATPPATGPATTAPTGTGAPAVQGATAGGQRRAFGPRGDLQIVEVDLAKVFADSKAGKMQPESVYQRICGVIPPELGGGGDMALDGDEQVVYFRIGAAEASRHLPPGTKPSENFGPRNMGSGPTGLMSFNISTKEIKFVCAVPFQIGHVQANPWMPGEIVFCWETGGKAPQRTWTVRGDGTGLRPLYPESEYEWVTHEAVISKDEVAIAIMGHRPVNVTINAPVTGFTGTGSTGIPNPVNPGQELGWGPSGTREKPTGLGIVNLRDHTMKIAGQTPSGSGLWHVNGSSDGRWAVGDDFSRSVYLIDRHTGEMMMLSTGHKETASDHPHPTFNADNTKIEIQSAMLAEDGKQMSICVIPVPDAWLKRTYKN